MTEEEYKESITDKFYRYLRELGFKTRDEQDKEALSTALDRLLMPKEQRAKELRNAGIGIRDISVCLELSKNTVNRILSPEAKEKNRIYMREYMRRYRARNKAE